MIEPEYLAAEVSNSFWNTVQCTEGGLSNSECRCRPATMIQALNPLIVTSSLHVAEASFILLDVWFNDDVNSTFRGLDGLSIKLVGSMVMYLQNSPGISWLASS